MRHHPDIEALIRTATPQQKQLLAEMLAQDLGSEWLPDKNNRPQQYAYVSKADILFYGGSAGGGKSDLLLGTALTQHHRSVIFRAQYTDIRGLEDRLLAIIETREGWNGQDKILRRNGKIIEFGALGQPGQERDWQGRPHDLIGFDEGTQLTADKILFVTSWLRHENPRQRCRIIIASNPPLGTDGMWVNEWFAPWIDPLYSNPAKYGELRWAVTLPDGSTRWCDGPDAIKIDGEEYVPMSRTFIRAKLEDNIHLHKPFWTTDPVTGEKIPPNTRYMQTLQSRPEPLRSQLLKGDFGVGRIDAPDQMIPSSWIREAQSRWTPTIDARQTMQVISLDIAWGGDKTVLAALYGNWYAPIIPVDGIDTKDGRKVAAAVINHRRDNALVCCDMTGGWGGGVRDHLVSNAIPFEGIVFNKASKARTKDGSLGFFNLRAEMWWRFREALDPKSGENVMLPPDERMVAELMAPKWEPRGDKILMESKDDIRLRIGGSTDRADAIVMAWAMRRQAMVWSQISGGRPITDSVPMEDPLAEYN